MRLTDPEIAEKRLRCLGGSRRIWQMHTRARAREIRAWLSMQEDLACRKLEQVKDLPVDRQRPAAHWNEAAVARLQTRCRSCVAKGARAQCQMWLGMTTYTSGFLQTAYTSARGGMHLEGLSIRYGRAVCETRPRGRGTSVRARRPSVQQQASYRPSCTADPPSSPLVSERKRKDKAKRRSRPDPVASRGALPIVSP